MTFRTLALLVLLPSAALAFDDDDRRRVIELSGEFDSLIAEDRYADTVNHIPPKILAAMAEAAGQDLRGFTAELKVMIADQMATSGEIESHAMRTDDMQGGDTAAGRSWALVPTESVIVTDGVRTRHATQTLFFEDEPGASDSWTLARIDNAQQTDILERVYPDLAEIEFPEGSVEVIE